MTAKPRATGAERVRVFCRLRPLLQREREGWSYEEYTARQLQAEADGPQTTDLEAATFLTDHQQQASALSSVVSIAADQQSVALHGSDSSKSFVFDSNLDESASQEQIYALVAKEIVQDALDGYNGTVLAYGQTSTGKTHTMLGKDDQLDGDQRGIIPRAMADIFDAMERSRSSIQTIVALSYVQIYCERIFDLLDPSVASSSIVVREDPDRGVYLDGATSVGVTNVTDCLDLVARGNANRAVASTGMNAQSSRSHAVLLLRIERKELDLKRITAGKGQTIRISHLHLVDLAGSERVKKTKVIGRHVSELKAINLSLSALGNCISALSKHQTTHVPYRDSKLTRLLQSSLGGNAKTSLVVTITPSPTERNETLSTLQFGQRAMQVAVNAHRNVMSVLDYKSLYEQMQQRLDAREESCQALEQEVCTAKNSARLVQDQLMKAQLRIQHLEFECDAAKAMASEKQADGTVAGLDVDNEAAVQRFSSLVAKHEQDMAKLKEQCDRQIETYKRLAQEATDEWHEAENALANEKSQVLASLQELKEFKLQFFQLEDHTTNRIAELVQEEDEQEHALKDQRETTQRQLAAKDKEIELLKEKLLESEARCERLQDDLETDFVPRSSIQEMEKLYEAAITKLQTRVGTLEVKSQSQRRLDDALPSNNQTADRTERSTNPKSRPPGATTIGSSNTLPAVNRAIPAIGRIVPASKTSNTGKSSHSLR